MFPQIKTSNQDLKIIKMNKIEILELKSTVTEIKNTLEGFSRGFGQAKERLTRRQVNWDYIIWGTESKIHKENEKCLRDLWNIISYEIICKISLRVEKGAERIIEIIKLQFPLWHVSHLEVVIPSWQQIKSWKKSINLVTSAREMRPQRKLLPL